MKTLVGTGIPTFDFNICECSQLHRSRGSHYRWLQFPKLLNQRNSATSICSHCSADPLAPPAPHREMPWVSSSGPLAESLISSTSYWRAAFGGTMAYGAPTDLRLKENELQ